MIDAIIYESRTGFTKKYAILLSEKRKLPVYSFKEAQNTVLTDKKIIYFGWLRANTIVKYQRARKLYNITAVGAVGVSPAKQENIENIIKNNGLQNIKFFYLKGGYDPTKSGAFVNFLMNIISKLADKKQNKIEEEIYMVEIMKNGGNMFDENLLDPIINYISDDIS